MIFVKLSVYFSENCALSSLLLLLIIQYLWSLIEICLMSTLLLTRSVLSLFFILVAHSVKKNSYFYIGNKYMDCVYHPKELMASI